MPMPAWVAEVGVAASVGIAVAAVWGDRIRASLFQPNLRIAVLNAEGQLERLVEPAESNHGVAGFAHGRYYRLVVTNSARHPEAREVEVLLTQLEIRGPDGKPV